MCSQIMNAILVFLLFSIGFAALFRAMFPADVWEDLIAALRQAAREFRRLRELRARRETLPDPFN